MIDALMMVYLIAELENMIFLYLNNLILGWFVNNIALIISITLLFFTLYSFYLINLRKGQIIVGSPTTLCSPETFDFIYPSILHGKEE